MQKFLASVLCLLLLSFTLSFTSAQEPNPPLELRIAIPVHHQHRSLNTGEHFHVLVKNISDAPLRLWTDKFSWGYDNLSFELVGEDGSVRPIKKKPRDWAKNYPDWLELQPGETYVLNVNLLDANIWENPPAAGPGKKPTRVKLRAVYATVPDQESAKVGVWTGKLQSPTDTYAIW